MVTHKDFESNCKRIAKLIMKEASNPTSDCVLFGSISIDVSLSLIENITENGTRKYEKRINDLLKCCHVTHSNVGHEETRKYYVLDVEFDD